MALSTAKELREALLLLREDEKARQKILDKQIRKRGVKKKVEKIVEDEEDDMFGPEKSDSKKVDDEPSDSDSEEKEKTAPPEEDEGGDDSETGSGEDKSNDKDKALAGARELNDTPQELPQSLKGNDFVDRINKIRAGASVKDTEVRDRIVDYVNRLTSEERNSLFITLDSLARIVLGGVDAAEVMTPSMVPAKSSSAEKPPEQKTKQQKSNAVKQKTEPISGPVVVVSEGIKKKYTEAPVVLRSGRSVPYGHKAHIADMEHLLSHLLNFRQCQERGSASDASMADAILTVKKQLSAARRKSMDISQKSTIDINIEAIPSLVEGE